MIIRPVDIAGKTSTNYPDPFRSLVAGRTKRKLGDAAGLKNFGVNMVTLAPGSCSALRHWHLNQDEFIYVLSGELTLVTDEGEHILQAGMAAGFPAGDPNGHHLINRSGSAASYLEIGDRTADEEVVYPDVDLTAHYHTGEWRFMHKDGTPYPS
ncbi:MAG: cupin domain-containing protein [Elainellaceae cyanobacterium]